MPNSVTNRIIKCIWLRVNQLSDSLGCNITFLHEARRYWFNIHINMINTHYFHIVEVVHRRLQGIIWKEIKSLLWRAVRCFLKQLASVSPRLMRGMPMNFNCCVCKKGSRQSGCVKNGPQHSAICMDILWHPINTSHCVRCQTRVDWL